MANSARRRRDREQTILQNKFACKQVCHDCPRNPQAVTSSARLTGKLLANDPPHSGECARRVRPIRPLYESPTVRAEEPLADASAFGSNSPMQQPAGNADDNRLARFNST